MRSQNLFLLGVCIAVTSTLGYFIFLRGSQRSMLERIGIGTSLPANALRPDESAPPPEKKKAEPPPRVRTASMHSMPAVEPEPAVVAVAPAPKPVTPVGPQPSPTDIRTGTDRSTLLKRYPNPSLQASTIKDGDLIELVVYHQDDQKVATFAQLQNGVVTRVYAGVSPKTLPR